MHFSVRIESDLYFWTSKKNPRVFKGTVARKCMSSKYLGRCLRPQIIIFMTIPYKVMLLEKFIFAI
jgi:hypothetical protein